MKFVNYKKCNEFIFAKFWKAFITEDLTQLKYKLLNYAKNNCDNRLTMCHSYNGKIRMKDLAKSRGDAINNDKDEGNGNWQVISSPNDLFE